MFKLFGVAQLMSLFKGFENVKFNEAWVGSAVEYGPMQEFGTKTLEERPHWRPALEEIATEIGSDKSLQGQVMEGLTSQGTQSIDAGGTAPIRVALMIERRVKEIIAAKGIFDTGNYRGSVAAGHTQDGAFATSASLAIDPDSVAS